MKKVWHLQEAKNHFSELIDRALTDGCQTVTRHGKAVAVVMSAQDFHRLQRPKGKLSEFFSQSPLKDVTLDLERKGDSPREVSL